MKYGSKILKRTGVKFFDDLILKLLEISPEKRISMKEYLKHPFFKDSFKYLKNPILNKNQEHMNSNK